MSHLNFLYSLFRTDDIPTMWQHA